MFTNINPLAKSTAIFEIIIMLLVAFILGYLICRCKNRCGKKAVIAGAAAVAAGAAVAKGGKDDLKLIEGIGPAIEKVLNNAGITTFAQVVELEVTEIRTILDNAGPQFKIRSGETWAEQAVLGRDGKFDELAVLREELDNGKHV